jgi:ATP-dependent DNA ligase
MTLPLKSPLLPQLAKGQRTLPDGDGWAFEPKWDGFRAIAFVDGDSCELQSRNGRPLARYFPELRFPSGRWVLDGEIVVRGPDGREDFDLIGQRVHPAASRIERLSVQTPARFLAFDLLASGDEVLLERPLAQRRAALEALLAGWAGPGSMEAPVELTPMVTGAAEAEVWLREAEGVVAKELSAPYRPGERAGMLKIKRVRTIDVVVMGWRPGKAQGTVGALILGLYEPDGTLREVGHSSGFTAEEKRELPALLAPLETGARGSGAPSRWSGGKDLEWVELRPELVAEITFDHTSNGRIRHGAKVQRWRGDKPAGECLVSQLDE